MSLEAFFRYSTKENRTENKIKRKAKQWYLKQSIILNHHTCTFEDQRQRLWKKQSV